MEHITSSHRSREIELPNDPESVSLDLVNNQSDKREIIELETGKLIEEISRYGEDLNNLQLTLDKKVSSGSVTENQKKEILSLVTKKQKGVLEKYKKYIDINLRRDEIDDGNKELDIKKIEIDLKEQSNELMDRRLAELGNRIGKGSLKILKCPVVISNEVLLPLLRSGKDALEELTEASVSAIKKLSGPISDAIRSLGNESVDVAVRAYHGTLDATSKSVGKLGECILTGVGNSLEPIMSGVGRGTGKMAGGIIKGAVDAFKQ